jgi:hypothetical protein
MYYWEPSPITGNWLTVYEGIPPIEGVDVSFDTPTVSIRVLYDPIAAIRDSNLRNFKRKAQSEPERFTFVNVARVYPMVFGIPKEGIEISCPQTLITFPFEDRLSTKSLRIMPKGVDVGLKVQVSGRRWVQKVFDKL